MPIVEILLFLGEKLSKQNMPLIDESILFKTFWSINRDSPENLSSNQTLDERVSFLTIKETRRLI